MKLLLYLYIFFIPFIATAIINIESISFGLQPSYFFMIILAVICSIRCLISEEEQRNLFKIIKISYPLILFWLMAILSNIALIVMGPHNFLVMSPELKWHYPYFSRINETQTLYISFILLNTIVLSWYLKNNKLLIKGIKVFFYSSIFVCLWGFFQLFCYISNLHYPTIFNNSLSWSQLIDHVSPYTNMRRVTSVAPEVAMLASYLTIPFVSSLVLLLKNSSFISYKVLITVNILCFTTLLLTTSSTAFITIIITFIYVLFLNIDTRKKFLLIISFALLALGIEVISFIYIKGGIIGKAIDRFADISYLKIPTAISRLEKFKSAINIFQEYPLFGIGYGTARSHDLLSNILMNTGILGFIMFVFVIYYWGIRPKKNVKIANESQKLLTAFRSAFLITFLIALWSNPDLVFLHLWFPVSIMISITAFNTDKPSAYSTDSYKQPA